MTVWGMEMVELVGWGAKSQINMGREEQGTWAAWHGMGGAWAGV